jgi:hypothetical protein
MWVLASCIGVLGLLYSKDSPAPPPPIACTTGVAAILALVFVTPPLNVAVNSHLSALSVQAFDAAGTALRDVPVTFTAPVSGPGGTFNILTDPDSDTYAPTADPQTTTVNTPSTCYGATPLFIANNTLGNYQIVATSGAAPSLFVPISNVSAGSLSTLRVSTAAQITHVGTAFRQPWTVQTILGSSGEVAGVPVSFNVPTSGPSGTFAGGSTSAAVLTNAFGRAYAPRLTANNVSGYFNVSVFAAGAAPVDVGPMINAADTVTTLERSGGTPSTTVFGHAVDMVARVQFTGFPRGGYLAGAPNPGGKVLLKSDGAVIGTAPLGDFLYRFIGCPTCLYFTVSFNLKSVTVPFGTRQLTAEYTSDGLYDSSTSNAITQTVQPEFTGLTANPAVQSAVGITGGTPDTWLCALSTAAWTSVASAEAVAPPGYAIPFGLFRYRLAGCNYQGATFSTPPAGFHARQLLVLQFTQPLPPGTVFLNYGPSRDNSSPHWYQVQSTVNGNVMQVALADSEPGDDDLVENAIIAGIGGPAVLQDQDPNRNGSYQGLWWNAPAGSESGWGLNFAHQGDVIFATWFTYDATGKGWWLAMTAPNSGGSTFAGTLYQANGPAFDAVPFNSTQVVGTPVGTGTLTFADANNGTFVYTVNGVSRTKNITREVFGVLPTCNFNLLNDLATATNYQDLWWNSPEGSESGWGINLTHQGDTIFGTWFTYDHDRSPMWLVVTATRGPTGLYSGDLLRTTGPAFNAVPFSPAAVNATKVGSATFSFVDGKRGNFSYTVNGTSQTKAITREVFRTPGTLCQ